MKKGAGMVLIFIGILALVFGIYMYWLGNRNHETLLWNAALGATNTIEEVQAVENQIRMGLAGIGIGIIFISGGTISYASGASDERKELEEANRKERQVDMTLMMEMSRPRPQVPLCPICSREIRFIHEQNKWWCDFCQKYLFENQGATTNFSSKACPHCGNINPSNVKACPNCGEPINMV